MKHKLLRTLALAVLFTCLAGLGPRAMVSRGEDTFQYVTLIGEWRQDDLGWSFALSYTDVRPASQWGAKDGQYYYFNQDGYMATGWQYVNGSWYYLNPDPGKWQGIRMTGWLHDSGYNGWFYFNDHGIMATGWHKIDGSWYYFNEVSDGALGLMAANKMVDGYYVDSTGQMNDPS